LAYKCFSNEVEYGTHRDSAVPSDVRLHILGLSLLFVHAGASSSSQLSAFTQGP